MTVVLDTSALLAALWGEAGSDRVDRVVGTARVSAVNLSELAAKLVDRGASDDEVGAVLDDLGVTVVPMEARQARAAGLLRRATRAAGLSLGDRACLALALAEGVPAMTADRVWADLDIGVKIEVIR
jgi:ribonuclease VapC